jgi:hypothetical protein
MEWDYRKQSHNKQRFFPSSHYPVCGYVDYDCDYVEPNCKNEYGSANMQAHPLNL